jgi:glycine/D-amino acid oxidase-like deaminating enzyme
MRNVDYIIVGCGLAGIAFCEILRAHNKTFLVYDNNSQQSSLVAAGLYNPVILKRFTPVWQVKTQLKIALPLYAKIEQDLNIKIDYPLRILRRFASVQEQNLWFTASDKPALEDFMNPTVIPNVNDNIDASFGFGEVLHAGRLDTEVLLKEYRLFLSKQGLLIAQKFNYDVVRSIDHHIYYENIQAKQIVFAEGFGMKQNPFFNTLPLNGTKGEVLTAYIPNLKIDFIVKSSVFVIPLGEDLYAVGSTYNWQDKTNHPTKEGKEELLRKLKTFITADIQIVDHVAGIRPTVKDRRPLVGSHQHYKNIHVLNGLGTRGVLIAPYVAEQLYRSIELNEPLDEDINIQRFIKD